MKCLVGLSTLEDLKGSLAMLENLRPDQLEAELLHVADISDAYPGFGLFPSPDLPGQLIDALEGESKRLSEDAIEILKAHGIHGETKVVWGSAGRMLLEEAEAWKADLVVVHRHQMSKMGRFILGSTTHAVALGARQSVLVTKGGVPKKVDGVTAVFGVDFSEYSMKCVDLLFAHKFRGIKKVYVLTAIGKSSRHIHAQGKEISPIDLTEKGEAICARFRSAGIEAMFGEETGHPNEVLSNAMNSSSADLMIVGAQGHGFIERLLIGSTSLHQVTMEQYPTLLLRV